MMDTRAIISVISHHPTCDFNESHGLNIWSAFWIIIQVINNVLSTKFSRIQLYNNRVKLSQKLNKIILELKEDTYDMIFSIADGGVEDVHGWWSKE